MIDTDIGEVVSESTQMFYRKLVPAIRENRVSVEFGRELLEFWRARLDDPSGLIREDFVEYCLFQESIDHGLVSATLYDTGAEKTSRHFGIFPEERAVEMLKQHFDFPELATQGQIFFEEQLLFFKVFPGAGGKKESSLLALSVEPLQEERFLYFEKILTGFEMNPYDEYSYSNNLYLYLKEELEFVLHKTEAKEATFVYLRLENLKKYFDYAGDYFGHEVVHMALNQIYTNVSGEIICYVMQPGQYLVLCPGKTEDELKKSLRKMTIKVKSLLLSYQVNYYSTKLPVENIDVIWEELITGK